MEKPFMSVACWSGPSHSYQFVPSFLFDLVFMFVSQLFDIWAYLDQNVKEGLDKNLKFKPKSKIMF